MIESEAVKRNEKGGSVREVQIEEVRWTGEYS